VPRFTILHDSQRFFSEVTTFIVRAARASGEKKGVIGVAIVCCSSIGARVVVRRQRPRPNIVGGPAGGVFPRSHCVGTQGTTPALNPHECELGC